MDEAGGPPSVLDLLDRVCTRLGVSEEERAFTRPRARQPLVLVRLAKALRDLRAVDAVESLDSGSLVISDNGRRMTEDAVVELSSANVETCAEDKPKAGAETAGTGEPVGRGCQEIP